MSYGHIAFSRHAANSAFIAAAFVQDQHQRVNTAADLLSLSLNDLNFVCQAVNWSLLVIQTFESVNGRSAAISSSSRLLLSASLSPVVCTGAQL